MTTEVSVHDVETIKVSSALYYPPTSTRADGFWSATLLITSAGDSRVKLTLFFDKDPGLYEGQVLVN